MLDISVSISRTLSLLLQGESRCYVCCSRRGVCVAASPSTARSGPRQRQYVCSDGSQKMGNVRLDVDSFLFDKLRKQSFPTDSSFLSSSPLSIPSIVGSRQNPHVLLTSWLQSSRLLIQGGFTSVSDIRFPTSPCVVVFVCETLQV